MCVVRSHQRHRSYRPRPSSTWSDSPKAVSKHQPGSRSRIAHSRSIGWSPPGRHQRLTTRRWVTETSPSLCTHKLDAEEWRTLSVQSGIRDQAATSPVWGVGRIQQTCLAGMEARSSSLESRWRPRISRQTAGHQRFLLVKTMSRTLTCRSKSVRLPPRSVK